MAFGWRVAQYLMYAGMVCFTGVSGNGPSDTLVNICFLKGHWNRWRKFS